MSIVESTRAFHSLGFYFAGALPDFLKQDHIGSQSVLVGSRVYLTGKIGLKPTLAGGTTVFMVDMTTRRTKTVSLETGPYARQHMFHLWGDSLYMYGGAYCENSQASRGIWRYDTVCEELSLVEARNAPPLYRESPIGGVLEKTGELLIYGGEISSTLLPTNEVFVFDLVAETWSQPKVKGRPPSARELSFGCMVKNQLYALDPTTQPYTPDRFHILDCRVKPYSWSQVKMAGAPRMYRRYYALTPLPGTSLLMNVGVSALDGSDSPFKVYDTSKGAWSEVYKHRTPRTKEERESMFTVVGTVGSSYYGTSVVVTHKGLLILGSMNGTRPTLLTAL